MSEHRQRAGFSSSGVKALWAAVLLAALLFLPALARHATAFGWQPHQGKPGFHPGTQPNPWYPVNPTLSAATGAAARLAQSGVTCEPGVPEGAIEACVGKNAGDACTVAHEDRSFAGTYAALPSGVLACQPPPPPPPPPGAVAACANLKAGDACQLTADDHTVDGLCRAFASGVVACVPVPLPLLGLIDACTGMNAGDPCTFTHEDDTVNGACTAIDALGGLLLCLPRQELTPTIDACDGKNAGDACAFELEGHAISGTCWMGPGQDFLSCSPKGIQVDPPLCFEKSAGDACQTEVGGELVDGICEPSFLFAPICVPRQMIPLEVCYGKTTEDACSFIGNDGRNISGTCAAAPDHAGVLICQPPPALALIDACSGKAAGDTCSATLGDRSFRGTCGFAADGTTLACMPLPQTRLLPRVVACAGMARGSLCTLRLDDRMQRGLCRPNDEGVLACLPPAPPQEAVDACSTLAVGDPCSFPWNGVNVSGACKALPGGSTLVCAPLCPRSGGRF